MAHILDDAAEVARFVSMKHAADGGAYAERTLAAAKRVLDAELRRAHSVELTIKIRVATDPNILCNDTEDVGHALRRLVDKWGEDGRVEFQPGEAGVIYADDGNDCGTWKAEQADHQTIFGGDF